MRYADAIVRDWRDLQWLLDEVIRERDELIERYESAKMALEDSETNCDEFMAEARRLKYENEELVQDIKNTSDALDEERDRVKRYAVERDEARKCAEEMRDLYAAEIDESIQVFPWPWEVSDE